MSSFKVDVATPERVAVELPIAGIGYRVLAYAIDLGILFSVVIVAYFIFTFMVADPLQTLRDLSTVLRIVLTVGSFAALWLYWTILEVVWSGQTIGKRLMRVRVVRSDGAPIGFGESALRNLLRTVDFLPVCYPIGATVMLIDKKHRRVGDIVAGTLLIREDAVDLSKYAVASTISSAAVAVSPQLVELATSYVQRFDAFEVEARTRLGRKLALRFGAEAQQADQLTDVEALAFLKQALGGATTNG